METKRKLKKVIAASAVAMTIGMVPVFDADAACYQRMKYCEGEMTVYNCDPDYYTSENCTQYYYQCYLCDC
ncbi:hypothetical protein [Cyclobacterium jeungdonense]|uniref:Uncharacterized protein n=1 Tax=Cyclobacterium jeungdonense TaxID=708087 RepID=A0ABT8C5X6_9BACT|nr:hypothetical protein [Cyclobacterium jeungdonense]MDN3688165.1 hypothetical protein [Cyclobacterium jeungdonense]